MDSGSCGFRIYFKTFLVHAAPPHVTPKLRQPCRCRERPVSARGVQRESPGSPDSEGDGRSGHAEPRCQVTAQSLRGVSGLIGDSGAVGMGAEGLWPSAEGIQENLGLAGRLSPHSGS